jgi:hypothetical protein
MPIKLYMDQHVPRAITVGLQLRGVRVVTAFEDGASRFDDAALLDRATALGCVLFRKMMIFWWKRPAVSVRDAILPASFLPGNSRYPSGNALMI